MAYEPRIAEMYDCCGIIVPYRFFKNPGYRAPGWYITNGYTKDKDEDERMTKEHNVSACAENEEEWIERVKTYLLKQQTDWQNKKSYLLVTLNGKENKVLGDMILSIGFEVLVPMTRNPGGSEIILYIFHLLPKEEKKEVHNSIIQSPAPVEVLPVVAPEAPAMTTGVEVSIRVTRG